MQEITFKSQSDTALLFIGRCHENGVILNFHGEFNDLRKEYSTEIQLPCHVRLDTQDGGSVYSDYCIKLCELGELPGWREQAADFTPGYMNFNFDAPVSRIDGDEITVVLPEYYMDEYRPHSDNDLMEVLTKKVSEEDGMAAIRILKAQLEFIGSDLESYLPFPVEMFDFENNCYDLSVLDYEDAEDAVEYINDAYFNSVCASEHNGKDIVVQIWADWDVYGFRSIKDVPVDSLGFICSVNIDSTYCYLFFESDMTLEEFLEMDAIRIYAEGNDALIERLRRIDRRKKEGKRP